MPLIFVSFHKINWFLRSLKLTVKAALWGIFSIATMVTYYRLWLTKNMRGLWGWIELFAGMGGDGTNIPSPCTPLDSGRHCSTPQ